MRKLSAAVVGERQGGKVNLYQQQVLNHKLEGTQRMHTAYIFQVNGFVDGDGLGEGDAMNEATTMPNRPQ